ncbi:hypothetical protein [Saccharomonospora viridis]|uniref:hypothetical protein n=1 Tax=Saccharomonospora viridis TaxID=1852 RepID=UPI0024097527|nr:hypothetical protein [Saccharomonospora viridis]
MPDSSVVALDADQLQAIRTEVLDLLHTAEAQAVQSGDRGRVVGVRTALALAEAVFDRLGRQGYAIHRKDVARVPRCSRRG